MPVKTPVDRSLAFTALLELSQEFKDLTSDQGSKVITRFLEAWYASTATDMFAFAREWLATARCGTCNRDAHRPDTGWQGHYWTLPGTSTEGR